MFFSSDLGGMGRFPVRVPSPFRSLLEIGNQVYVLFFYLEVPLAYFIFFSMPKSLPFPLTQAV